MAAPAGRRGDRRAARAASRTAGAGDMHGGHDRASSRRCCRPRALCIGPSHRRPRGDPAPLPAYAVATRLAYLVTSTAPDDALLNAAADGSLTTHRGADRRDRSLAGDAARAGSIPALGQRVVGAGSLARRIRRTPTCFETGATMCRRRSPKRSRLFLADAWQKGPTLRGLLTGTTTFADANLAAFYGFPPPSGPGFQPVRSVARARVRAAHPGRFLATHAKANQTSPVHARQIRARAAVLHHAAASAARHRGHAADASTPALDARAIPEAQRGPVLRDLPSADGPHRLRVRALRRHRPLARSRRRPAHRCHRRARPGPTSTATSTASELARASRRASRCASCVATQWFRWAFGRAEADSDDLCTIATLAPRWTTRTAICAAS